MVSMLRRLTSTFAGLLLPVTVSGEVIHEPLWVENLSPLATALTILHSLLEPLSSIMCTDYLSLRTPLITKPTIWKLCGWYDIEPEFIL